MEPLHIGLGTERVKNDLIGFILRTLNVVPEQRVTVCLQDVCSRRSPTLMEMSSLDPKGPVRSAGAG